MSIAVKVSKLRSQIKDLTKDIANVPLSALDLILTGVEVQLKEIQQDANALEQDNAKPAQVAKKTVNIDPNLPESSQRGYGQGKKS